jgi:hypothetical protein
MCGSSRRSCGVGIMKEKFGNNVNKLLEVLLAVPFSRLTKKQAGRVQNGQILLLLMQNWPIFEVS